MTKISRNDLFMRSEKGPSWFDEFLKTYAETGEKSEASSINDILSAIQDKRGETVASVVENYRKQVGLDAITAGSQIKQASSDTMFLSNRHASLKEEDHGVVVLIQKDPSIAKAIDSFCEHSGGNKGTHAIINFLRNKLGKEKVSYTDQELIDFIESRKKSFQNGDDELVIEVGEVGLSGDGDDYEDKMADYVTHGKSGDQ